MFNEQVDEELEFQCSQLVDQRVEKIADLGVELETHVQDVVERNAEVTSAETGIVYPEDLAVGAEPVGDRADRFRMVGPRFWGF